MEQMLLDHVLCKYVPFYVLKVWLNVKFLIACRNLHHSTSINNALVTITLS